MFAEEFELKYYRKSPKTTIFRYCGIGTVQIVRARKIADFYQIKRKYSQKVNRKLKINKKSWDTTRGTSSYPQKS